MNTHCRIGRVKLKDGPVIVRLPTEHERNVATVKRWFALALQDMEDVDPIAGYAIVLWDREGRSTVRYGARWGSPIPTALIPDFVRNLLLAERIETWTIDTVNESWGYPPRHNR